MTGYGVASFESLEWPESGSAEVDLTDRLGCRYTSVAAVRLREGILELPAEREQVCIAVGDSAPLRLDAGLTIPVAGVGYVPAGMSSSVRCGGEASAFVVSATAASVSDGVPTALSLDDCEFTLPSTSDIATARLTRPLGCRGMKVNARLLEPGDVVPYHTEGEQEELFVPVSGPCAMRIDDESVETPPGSVVRVAPEVPRSALDDGDADGLWVMVGAPPTGGPEEWDPGAETVE